MSKSKRIILILSLIVFIACTAYLGKYFYDSKKAADSFSELQDIVGNEDITEDGVDETDDAEDTEEQEQPDTYAPNGMIQGYYDAYIKNNDMVGWIRIPDTKINYPVMQADDNDFYLKRDFNKKYSYGGIPFMDYQCDVLKPSDILVIYAHHMRDGSMFAKLSAYADKTFLQNHQTVHFDTNYNRGKYRIFAVLTTKVGTNDEFIYNRRFDFESGDDFLRFMNEAKGNALYTTGETVKFGDKILILSTCSYNRSNERMIVMAKKTE